MTLRLAALGRLDFSCFDRFDSQWWLLWRYQIKQLENDDQQQTLLRRFQFNLAYVSSPKISSEDFSKKQKEAITNYEDFRGTLAPWLGRNSDERHVSEYAKFREDWQRLAGFDPEDAEALKNWEENLLGGVEAKMAQGQAAAEAAQAQLAASIEIMENIQKRRAEQTARSTRRGKF